MAISNLEISWTNDEDWNEIIVDSNITNGIKKCRNLVIATLCISYNEDESNHSYMIELKLQLINEAIN